MSQTKLSSQNSQTKPYIDSEHYRQMLVKDGERRFHEWHSAFLHHQKQFLQEIAQMRQR